ncbi:hypothetical protein M989_04206 [Kluyvera georgiana ATCC 51603]|uniref:Uncharacterized protein n=1 Tax=Kluyvera georgiana ATCC 51603 TaxID=1354264 RepID=A0A1B7JF51_9ENTR|nr:hypothetical protein [Kluyvera georgiana]OAT46234.1 hypothetical protein M989_04206 [Kluyvera georgiana ATCC 51603]
MELNERLTDVELNRLIWGLEAHGNMKRTLAGLDELRARRKEEAAKAGLFFPSPESLAQAIAAVRCFDELSAELIAEEMFKGGAV